MEQLWSKTGTVIVDGDNIAYLWKDYALQDQVALNPVEHVVQLVQTLGASPSLVMVFFSVRIYRKLTLEDQRKLGQGVAEGRYQILPPSIDPTEFFAMLAESAERKFVVISNDLFPDRQYWFQRQRIGVMLDHAHRVALAVSPLMMEQLLGKAPVEVLEGAC